MAGSAETVVYEGTPDHCELCGATEPEAGYSWAFVGRPATPDWSVVCSVACAAAWAERAGADRRQVEELGR
jgi:hypothetical protein